MTIFPIVLDKWRTTKIPTWKNVDSSAIHPGLTYLNNQRFRSKQRVIDSQRLIVDDNFEVPPGAGNGEVVVLRLRDDDIVTQA